LALPADAPVEIVAYDAAWPRRFDEEARLLRELLRPWLAGPIEHIGSTAVPGLAPSRSSTSSPPLKVSMRPVRRSRRWQRRATAAKQPFIERVTALALQQR
jgi:GrpB-like predicted nucleotidyltransferase (UPF0157 family)